VGFLSRSDVCNCQANLEVFITAVMTDAEEKKFTSARHQLISSNTFGKQSCFREPCSFSHSTERNTTHQSLRQK